METKRVSAVSALAATLGQSVGELAEYRYQSTRFSRAVYAIGNQYFCIGKKRPDLGPLMSGLEWRKHSDQFWAERAGSVIWVADATGSKPAVADDLAAECDRLRAGLMAIVNYSRFEPASVQAVEFRKIARETLEGCSRPVTKGGK